MRIKSHAVSGRCPVYNGFPHWRKSGSYHLRQCKGDVFISYRKYVCGIETIYILFNRESELNLVRPMACRCPNNKRYKAASGHSDKYEEIHDLLNIVCLFTHWPCEICRKWVVFKLIQVIDGWSIFCEFVFGSLKQKALPRANVNLDIFRLMASLAHNVLITSNSFRNEFRRLFPPQSF